MQPDLPMVSIVLACRNERAYIRRCVESLLGGDYPADRRELLLVDGLSADGTREILEECAREHAGIRVLDNPRRITPVALNLGLAAARGSIVMISGAHAEFPPEYVRELVTWLEWSGADGVGACCDTVPGAPTTMARAIAVALSHPFGVGNAWFRIGSREPRYVDTVPFGCYRAELFRRIGGFDEDLVRNQDDEFNLRVIRGGGRLLLVPSVAFRYFGRTRMREVARMFYQYGRFKPAVMRRHGIGSLRQLVPGAFVAALGMAFAAGPWVPGGILVAAAIVVAYFLAAAGACATTVRRHGLAVAFSLLLVFPVIHLAYGSGYLLGLARLAGIPAGRTPAPDTVPLSR